MQRRVLAYGGFRRKIAKSHRFRRPHRFEKIGILATNEHRSVTNYIEFVLLKHLEDVEREHGEIKTGGTEV